jgi:8-oxo-dGTP pyrophosphatase MutT (NUDIX family)
MKFTNYISSQFLGAGAVFRTSNNKILILQKPNGKWSFPGGHREKEETPMQTVKRECIEEIGIWPRGTTTDMVLYVKKENNKKCYSFIIDIEDEFVPVLSDEHVHYKWVYPKALTNLNLTGAIRDLWPNLKLHLI